MATNDLCISLLALQRKHQQAQLVRMASCKCRLGFSWMLNRLSWAAGCVEGAADLISAAVGADLAVATPLRYLDTFASIIEGLPGSKRRPGSPSSQRSPGSDPAAAALATAALSHRHALHVRPAVMAATALMLHRMQHGVLPAWPLMLARLTGIAGPGTSEFDAALAVVASANAPQPVTSANAPQPVTSSVGMSSAAPPHFLSCSGL